MRISFKGDYALKTLLDLAVKANAGPVKISDIAKRQDIPLKYLEQLLLQLKGAGFVKSKRGQDGGYFLARIAASITLGEVIRVMEGFTSPITCVSRSCFSRCADEKKCPFRSTWEKVRDSVNAIVDTTTIEDIAGKVVNGDEEDYSI